MPSSPFEPFTLLGKTPKIKKTHLGGILGDSSAVALSPVAPLVVETGNLDDGSDVLRITDYRAGTALGHIPAQFHYDALSFSPDGKYLLLRWLNILQVYSEPWTSPQIIHDQHIPPGIFDATWFDNQTILIAGILNHNDLCIAVLEVSSGSLSIVHTESPSTSISSSEAKLDSGACSASGLVAFSLGYGNQIVWYQLNQAGNAVVSKYSFHVGYDGYILNILTEENGQSILALSGNYQYNRRVGLFNLQGNHLSSLPLYVSREGALYQYGTVCLQHSSRYEHTLQIYKIRDGQFLSWCSLDHSKGRGVDLALHNDQIILAIEEEEQTSIFELTDYEIIQLGSQIAQQRVEAAQSLGRRRLQRAIPALERTLVDEVVGVQVAAIKALAEIGDPKALPYMMRALGRTQDTYLRNVLILAVRRFR